MLARLGEQRLLVTYPRRKVKLSRARRSSLGVWIWRWPMKPKSRWPMSSAINSTTLGAAPEGPAREPDVSQRHDPIARMAVTELTAVPSSGGDHCVVRFSCHDHPLLACSISALSALASGWSGSALRTSSRVALAWSRWPEPKLGPGELDLDVVGLLGLESQARSGTPRRPAGISSASTGRRPGGRGSPGHRR